MIYKSNIVALYDENDVCVFVAETWKELANFLGKTIESTQSSMAHILKKTGGYDRRNFVCDGKKLATGSGRSKKQAEMEAAKNALEA